MKTLLDKYLDSHCSLSSVGLDWIEKQTNIRTNYPQMLCGRVQGEFLKMLAELSGACRVLEIGTFTGYSAACMALGLPEGGHIDALEINDELEDLILEGWEKCGVRSKITLHIGDALETIGGGLVAPNAGAGLYDMVYIDANKREYLEYYEAVLPLLRPGGLIVADDVLLGGKVQSEAPSSDPQTRGLISFNEFVAADPRVDSVIIPLRDGLTLLRKKVLG